MATSSEYAGESAAAQRGALRGNVRTASIVAAGHKQSFGGHDARSHRF